MWRGKGMRSRCGAFSASVRPNRQTMPVFSPIEFSPALGYLVLPLEKWLSATPAVMSTSRRTCQRRKQSMPM